MGTGRKKGSARRESFVTCTQCMSWLEMKGTAKATIEPSRLMEWFNLIAGKRSTRAIDELVYCLCWELF